MWEVGDPYLYPYAVDLSVEPKPVQVQVSEGVTHSTAAAKITVEEALSEKWAEHFTKAEAEWLLPILLRLQHGGEVTEEELVSEFRARHGRDPRIFVSRLG